MKTLLLKLAILTMLMVLFEGKNLLAQNSTLSSTDFSSSDFASLPDNYIVQQHGICVFAVPYSNKAIILELASACNKSAAKIYEQLATNKIAPNIQNKKTVNITIVSNPNEIQNVGPIGASVPHWAGAVAFTKFNLIVLSLHHKDGRPVKNIDIVLEHELSHLAMRQAIGNAHVPRWFSEGVAILQSEGTSITREGAIWFAALGNRLHPLCEIANYSDNMHQANLAYAQAADFTEFLIKKYGWNGIKVVLSNLADGKNFNDSFYSAYGYSVVQLEKVWINGLSKKYNWLVVITGSGALWGFITILFIWAYFAVKKRRKIRLEEMEEEEKPLEQLILTIEKLEKTSSSALNIENKINDKNNLSSKIESKEPSEIEINVDMHTLH